MKKQRRRERSVGQAITLSVLTDFGVGIVIAITLLVQQYSKFRNLYDLLRYNEYGGVYSSDLYYDLNHTRAIQDTIVTAICTFAGGIVLALLVPKQLPAKKTFGASLLATLIFLVLTVGFPWVVRLINENGRLNPQDINPSFLEYQTICTIGWLIMGIAGTALARWWRLRRDQKTTDPAAAKSPAPRAAR
jgi:hypothetical protein